MVTKYIRLLFVVGIVCVMASASVASVVTITPTNPGDWSWMTNSSEDRAKVCFTTGGPAPAEGNPFPTENGAFYAQLSWNESPTPDSAWLGLDKHNGQDLAGIPLKNIKTLKYVTYNAGMYNWNIDDARRYCKQPFMVTLTVVCPTTGDRRQFIHRPWGYDGWPLKNNRREWQAIDAINQTMVPNNQEGNTAPMTWIDPSTKASIHTFAELIARDPGEGRPLYGDWLLVPTSTTWDTANGQWKSAGWDAGTDPPGDPSATGTGKCLNLWTGARKSSCSIWSSWITESAGFKGYVDSLTLGVDYGTPENPNVVETTYDFASDDPAPQVFAVCNTGQSRWAANPPEDYPYATYNAIMDHQEKTLYRFFGRVIDAGLDTVTGEFWFTLWDRSIAPTSPWIDPTASVTVRWPWQDSKELNEYYDWLWPVQVGDWVSSEGFLYDAWYFQWKPPAEMTSNAANTVIYYMENPHD